MSKFHVYHQHDSMQCGIACLQMICKYHGKEYSQDTLSRYCFATNEGVSLLGISEAATRLGLHTTCGRVTTEQLHKAPLPCILHWNQNHFVVLYRIKKGKICYIADPGKGLVTYDDREFKEHWLSTRSNGEEKGIAMFIQPTPAFHELSIVDVGIVHQNLNFIYLILLGQLVLTISRASVDFIRRWILLHISMRINISLVSDFFIKLLKLPMSFFDTKLMGDLMQRMNDHNRIEKFLTTQMLNVTFSLLSFVVFGCVLFSYNLTIFCIFLLASVLYALWIALFLGKRKILDYELFEKQEENSNKTYQTQEAGSIFINEVKNIVITVVAATAVIHGQMTLGMMLAVQYIIGQLNSPVEQLMSFLYSLQDVKISLERINEIHKMKNEENEHRLLNEIPGISNDLSFEHVGFKYDPHSPKMTIEDVSLTIPETKVTAIVGASGSGKTTLLKLLLGYYPVMNGEIKIGEANLNSFNLKWWRRQCGVVMQDGVIFSESIARNIAVDDGDIDGERLLRAVEIANIKEFIMSLPMRFSTMIGRDGIGLSQGQKQRILIARAVYKDPLYIFLDEATNALDAKNERTIVENLDQFYKGRTVVVVAHRLSTVKNAHQIIVLDKGRIVETGNHASLIEKKGAYYNLVKNQLELGN